MSYTKKNLNVITLFLTIIIFICLFLINSQISLLVNSYNNSKNNQNKNLNVSNSSLIPIKNQLRIINNSLNINDENLNLSNYNPKSISVIYLQNEFDLKRNGAILNKQDDFSQSTINKENMQNQLNKNLNEQFLENQNNETSKASNEQKQNITNLNQQIKTQRQVVQENKMSKWRIQIPKLGLDAHIEEGTSSNTLLKAVGHFEESTKWNGNICLAAHNRGYMCNFFEKIKKLKLGDEIIYITEKGKKVYKVTTNKVILETDWSYIQSTADNRITLITCEENRPEYRRCVQAVQVTDSFTL